MKRSTLNGRPQVVSVAPPHGGALAPVSANPIIVQMPASAQLMTLVNQVLASPDAVIQHAVSLIDEQHNSVTIRERIVVYIEED
jgi:hypothetical protein